MEKSLQDLFDSKHVLNNKQLSYIQDKDITLLNKMVSGEISSPDRTVAMDALSRLSPKKARIAISNIFLEPDTPSVIRATAATRLGRLGGTNVEEALLKGLEIKASPVVNIKVVAALGKIGTEHSVKALKRLVEISGLLQRQAKFSLYLINFRYHKSDYLPPIPTDANLLVPKREGGNCFKIEPASSDLMSQVIDYLKNDSYGLKLSEKSGFHIDCGSNKFAIVFDESILRAGLIPVIQTKPALVGLVAQRAPVDGSYSNRYIFMAWPIGQEKPIQIAAYRTDGFLVLSGTLDIHEERGTFELFSVKEGANVASRIRGQVERSQIDFQETTTGEKIIGSRSPVQINKATSR